MVDSCRAPLDPALGEGGGGFARGPTRQSLRGAARRQGRERVSWRSTFIELGDAEHNGSLSPRPSSEPCSESSSSRSAFFDVDRSCVAALSKHMEEAWASNSREKMRQLLSADRESVSHSAGAATPSASAGEAHELDLRGPGEATGETRSGAVERARGRLAAGDAEHDGGISSAWQAIHAIPEHVGAFLQQHSMNVVAQVQGEVAEVYSLLSELDRPDARPPGSPHLPAGHPQSKYRALDDALIEFEEIPDRIRSSFEVSIARATDLFWMRVRDVMKSLGDENSTGKEVVEQMRRIPKEVQQIAAEAVEQAVLDSQLEVSRMCDSLIESLEEKRWKKSSQKVSSMKARICEQVPRAIQPTIQAALSAASASVEQAVKAYEDPELPTQVPNQLANEVVAEVLLRVKAEEGMERPQGTVQVEQVERVHASGSSATCEESGPDKQESTPEQVHASRASSSFSPLMQRASKSDCPLQHELQHTKAGGSDSEGSLDRVGWIRRPMVDVMSEPCVTRCREVVKAMPSVATREDGQAVLTQSGYSRVSPSTLSGGSPCGPSRAEIRSRIHAKAERTSFKRRLSAAAEAIDNIPEQLNSVVQNKAKSLADSVETDLALVQKAIRRSGGDDDVVGVAIDQLGEIPEIIRMSFDSKITEANDAMRTKLSAVMQGFKSTTSERQEVVAQLWTIPEELEQITGEAVDQAVQESQREAAKHCDRVLRSLPEDAGVSRRALKDAKLQIVEAVPEMYSETMRALRRTTNANVKHAVAHVDNHSEVRVTNRLVADVLLRAKVGTLPQTDGSSVSQSRQSAAGIVSRVEGGGVEGAPADQCGWRQAIGPADAINVPGLVDARGAPADQRGQQQSDGLASAAEDLAGRLGEEARVVPASHLNAGSLGHPEMCVRPCLYFSRGQCTNGDGCRFCHYQHPTRPVHLGRQHRKTLEAATTAECFGISLPVLERKLATLNLPTGILRTRAGQYAASAGLAVAEAGGRVKARELRTLEKAFGALSMRSLLVVLQRKVGPQASDEKALLDALLLQLREVGFVVDIGEEAHEDA